MAVQRVKFIDPIGVRATYSWQINFSEEQEFGKQRNVERGAKSGTGLIIQQTDDSPMVIAVSGTILHKAQIQEMIAWYNLCGGSAPRTIYFEDFDGERFEVLITSFLPTRHRTIRNPRDFANMPYWFYRYELRMEVVRVVSGIWA